MLCLMLNGAGSAGRPAPEKLVNIHNGSRVINFSCFADDSGDCCGSKVNFGDTMPASSFMRQAAGPTFYVKQGLSGRRDVAPPSRVIDFHVSSIVNDSLYVASLANAKIWLQWQCH